MTRGDSSRPTPRQEVDARRPTVPLLATAILALAGGSMAQELAPGETLPLRPARSLSFETDEGTWMSLDVSPDGTTIVFDLLGDLYTLPIGGGDARRISGGMAMDNQPRFSPDGRHIVFTSDRSGEDRIWIMDAGTLIGSGQEEQGLRKVSRDTNASYVSPEWTPDGAEIVATQIEGYFAYRPGVRHLFAYPVAGGPGRNLMPEEKRRAYSPTFGPDRRFLYYSSRTSEGSSKDQPFAWSVMVLDRETGLSRPVVSRLGAAFRPAVSPDGRWLVYATRMDGETGLRLRELATGDDRWLAYPVTRDDIESLYTRDLYPGYAFTPDGLALVATMDGKFWRIAIPGGALSPIPFTADVHQEIGPETHFQSRLPEGPVRVRWLSQAPLSPDGKTLAVSALHALYLQDVAGGSPRQIAAAPAFQPAWSPDGRRLAYVAWSADGGGEVHVVPAEGGSARRVARADGTLDFPVWADPQTLVAHRRAPDALGCGGVHDRPDSRAGRRARGGAERGRRVPGPERERRARVRVRGKRHRLGRARRLGTASRDRLRRAGALLRRDRQGRRGGNGPLALPRVPAAPPSPRNGRAGERVGRRHGSAPDPDGGEHRVVGAGRSRGGVGPRSHGVPARA